MNRKGFVFVETIVVTVVLAVALIFIYATFSSVLTSEKRHMAYDDTGYMYRTFYIQNFLATIDIKGYINNHFDNDTTLIKQLYCNDVSLYHNNEEMQSMALVCEKLINVSDTLDIKNVYVTKYDLSDLKNCIYNNCSNTNLKRNIENLDLAFINYIKSLKPNHFYNDKYRLVIEYEEKELDYTNYMKPKNSTCQADYKLIDNKCIREVHKFYFDNIIINTTVNYSNGGNNNTLTYDSQGGSECPSKTVTEGNTWGELCSPTKSGSNFGGWFTEANGAGNEITSDSVASGNLNVFAKWSTSNYTLTYDSQGGSSCSSKSAQAGGTWGTLCSPTRDGYSFGGWYTSTNGGGSRVTSSTSVNGNLKVYAKWTIDSRYIYASAGTGGSVSPSSKSLDYNSSASFTVTPNTGYYLSSYSCDSGLTLSSSFNTGSSYTSSQTRTITNSSSGTGSKYCYFYFSTSSRRIYTRTYLNEDIIVDSGSDVVVDTGDDVVVDTGDDVVVDTVIVCDVSPYYRDLKYGESGTFTVELGSNFYLYYISCDSGVTYSGFSTGKSTKGRTITGTIKNNSTGSDTKYCNFYYHYYR